LEPLREFFESLAITWDSHQPENRTSLINEMLCVVENFTTEPDSILDIGTGTGAIIPLLKKRYPKSSIISIDLATEMLLHARARVSNANLVEADVHRLPFIGQSFSAVICHNSFPHFSNKTVALVEIKRMLTSGGIFVIFHDCSREKVNEVHQHARSMAIHHDLLPTMEELCEMLKNEDFESLFTVDDDSKFMVISRQILQTKP
jgi:ubiquinone/menaquinone biosynthesis C-methylase UbiE